MADTQAKQPAPAKAPAVNMDAKRKEIAAKVAAAEKAKAEAEKAIKDATAAEIELQADAASLSDCIAQQRKSLEAARKEKK